MRAKHRELKAVVRELKILKKEEPIGDTLYHNGVVVFAMDKEERRRDLGPLKKYGLESGKESLVFYKIEIEGKRRTVWPAAFEEHV